MNYLKMKTIRNIYFTIAGVMILLGFNACSKKISFQQSEVVPAARGTVNVKEDDNGNYHIKITITGLAEPDRLQPSKNTYVVWVQTENDGAKNIGQIDSSTGFLSSKLKASFEGISPFKPIKIFITGEDDAHSQYPGRLVVLATNNF